MKLGVPNEKDAKFGITFFQCISDNLDDLRFETNKWPDQIIFSGPLGKELFTFLENSGWDLRQFNPEFEGTADKITFKYSKVLTLIEDANAPDLDSSMEAKMMKGIPSQNTMNKVTKAYISTSSFRKERTARPQIIVRLFRT